MNLTDYLETENSETKEQLQELMASYPSDTPVLPVSLQRGASLILEGDPCKQVYLLIKGHVSVIISQPRFSSYTVTEFSPFEFFGEYELLAGIPHYLAEVKASSVCRLLAFPSETYLRWVKSDPQFFFGRVRSILGTLLDQAGNERTRHFLNATGRVIQILIRASDLCLPQRESVRLSLSRMEIAERTGCSIRTVNRVIRELYQKGLLTIVHGKIHLNAAQRERLLREFDLRLQ